jgi:hypothetical protein
MNNFIYTEDFSVCISTIFAGIQITDGDSAPPICAVHDETGVKTIQRIDYIIQNAFSQQWTI